MSLAVTIDTNAAEHAKLVKYAVLKAVSALGAEMDQQPRVKLINVSDETTQHDLCERVMG